MLGACSLVFKALFGNPLHTSLDSMPLVRWCFIMFQNRVSPYFITKLHKAKICPQVSCVTFLAIHRTQGFQGCLGHLYRDWRCSPWSTIPSPGYISMPWCSCSRWGMRYEPITVVCVNHHLAFHLIPICLGWPYQEPRLWTRHLPGALRQKHKSLHHDTIAMRWDRQHYWDNTSLYIFNVEIEEKSWLRYWLKHIKRQIQE